MKYVKINSIAEIKKDIARKCKVLSKNGYSGYNELLEKNLVLLSKIIRNKVCKKFSVQLFLYFDEYTFNIISDNCNWTSGVDERGLVNWVIVDVKNNFSDRGSFMLGEEDERFYNCLRIINEKIQ